MSDRVQALKDGFDKVITAICNDVYRLTMQREYVSAKDREGYREDLVSFLASQELGQMIDGKFVPL